MCIRDRNRAVERLDPEERALVTLFYYEDRSVGECAAITELSEGNVKVQLHRIRKKLYVLVNDEMNGTESVSYTHLICHVQ